MPRVLVRLKVVQDDEPVIDFVDGSGAVWRRMGFCNRCGDCCRSGDPFNGGEGAAEVEGACPKLTVAEDGAYACSYRVGRAPDRGYSYTQTACIHWPSEPEHLTAYPDCSYRFERVG